jgi:ribosomal protein S18 acetylase RimI-like enzyme
MPRDLGQIVELLRLVFGEALDADDRQLFGNNGYNAVNELVVRFNPASSRLSHGFVWQADGRIIGNATLLTTKMWDRYLVANVAVHPNYRRQGIARGLMQAITASVRARGGRDILLQVVKANQPAIDLYESLGYTRIGNVTTWHASATRLRPIPDGEERAPEILPLPGRRWRDAYALDVAAVPADLNWPEPLLPDAYRRMWWQRAADFMNGRQVETWMAAEGDTLTGLVTIASEWGRSHLLSLRVKPDHQRQLERPLLAKALRRLHYLARRSARIDHPESDEVAGQLLQEANFTVQRTLTHMRLDLRQ